jgi:hypothetical protein
MLADEAFMRWLVTSTAGATCAKVIDAKKERTRREMPYTTAMLQLYAVSSQSSVPARAPPMPQRAFDRCIDNAFVDLQRERNKQRKKESFVSNSTLLKHWTGDNAGLADDDNVENGATADDDRAAALDFLLNECVGAGGDDD